MGRFVVLPCVCENSQWSSRFRGRLLNQRLNNPVETISLIYIMEFDRSGMLCYKCSAGLREDGPGEAQCFDGVGRCQGGTEPDPDLRFRIAHGQPSCRAVCQAGSYGAFSTHLPVLRVSPCSALRAVGWIWGVPDLGRRSPGGCPDGFRFTERRWNKAQEETTRHFGLLTVVAVEEDSKTRPWFDRATGEWNNPRED